MIKVLHIVGARPQFIKLYPLHLEMKERGFEQKILHTGQHFDKNMSDIFFEEMGIPQPDFNLNIHSLSHGAMTGRMIEEIEKIMLNEKFNYIIVYGDTNSTLAGAIAASKLNIKIVHIEAGVRNFDNTMPEEINRILTDRISDLLLCPTDESVNNLNQEGILHGINCGDLMYDASLMFRNKLVKTKEDPYILVTCHRASNTNKENLTEIITALNDISKQIKVVLPIHPRTKHILNNINIKPQFKIIEPIGYLEMLNLIYNSKYIITDSGGVVREAYFFNKPSLLILEDPLWPELVKAGVCINCKPIATIIKNQFNKLQNINVSYIKGILGEGNSRKIITDLLC
jgi:UDP-GlcNAc3NAcA epimerase